MPRPREFDEDDVVTRATDLFWRRGYHATSVRDLGEALGLSASSLYRTFGDKHALFLRASTTTGPRTPPRRARTCCGPGRRGRCCATG